VLVLLAGCQKKAVEEARQEAKEAKVTVQQLKHSLGLAQKEIADVRAELKAVRQSRDELQDRIDRAQKERDQALGYVQQVQEAVTTQSSSQTTAMAALQKQVAELNALVDAQQKEIELLKDQSAESATPMPGDRITEGDPNEDQL
jgi:predicted RNase H-like nuclease (RuvC/YqgF family)